MTWRKILKIYNPSDVIKLFEELRFICLNWLMERYKDDLSVPYEEQKQKKQAVTLKITYTLKDIKAMVDGRSSISAKPFATIIKLTEMDSMISDMCDQLYEILEWRDKHS